ncbi:MAG TPA: alpha/beta fold hydrolase [Puia sp.]
MHKFASTLFLLLFTATIAFSQTDSLVLKDIEWDAISPAGQTELFIPSGGSVLAGFIYRANGAQKHPTLLLLHGYPGNERNLDLAQVARARGWNVIYFDYRGSWGSPGNFSFKNCVEDVANVVSFCKKYQDSLKIDTANIVLFGHSMGGFVCLKALQQIPGIKKGFALSTWDIYKGLSKVKSEKALQEMVTNPNFGPKYFVLNASLMDIFSPVLKDPDYFNLSGTNARNALAGKQIILLDEHQGNKELADELKASNKAYFHYEVWKTDHPFTNKRVALIKMVLAFLAR